MRLGVSNYRLFAYSTAICAYATVRQVQFQNKNQVCFYIQLASRALRIDCDSQLVELYYKQEAEVEMKRVTMKFNVLNPFMKLSSGSSLIPRSDATQCRRQK